jgi:hypothetical protein
VGLRARRGRVTGRAGLVRFVRARLGADGICALDALDAHAPGRREGAGVGFCAGACGGQAQVELLAGWSNGGRGANHDRWGRRFSEGTYLSVRASESWWDQGERESDVFSWRRPISVGQQRHREVAGKDAERPGAGAVRAEQKLVAEG